MNPNGLLVPTVAAVSRALASVRWRQQQQLVRWQRSSSCYAAAAAGVDEAQTQGVEEAGREALPGATWFLQTLLFAPLSPCAYFPPPLHLDTVAVANLAANPWPWSARQRTVPPISNFKFQIFKAHEDTVEP